LISCCPVFDGSMPGSAHHLSCAPAFPQLTSVSPVTSDSFAEPADVPQPGQQHAAGSAVTTRTVLAAIDVHLDDIDTLQPQQGTRPQFSDHVSSDKIMILRAAGAPAHPTSGYPCNHTPIAIRDHPNAPARLTSKSPRSSGPLPLDDASRTNAAKLSRCWESFEFDRWWAGVGGADVAEAFDPVGVVAGTFHDAGASPVAAQRVKPLQYLGEDGRDDRGQVVRGKRPPDHRSGGGRGGRCG
jgi:hypothetical protein